MIKLIFSNLSAILTLKPNFASNPTIRKIILLAIVGLQMLGYLFILWILYISTISPMIEVGLLDGKDLNYDGLYTYKDLLLSIFIPGGTLLINILNIFTTPGNFFELEPITYKAGNIIRYGLVYLLVFTPIWFFAFTYWLQEIVDSRLNAEPKNKSNNLNDEKN